MGVSGRKSSGHTQHLLFMWRGGEPSLHMSEEEHKTSSHVFVTAPEELEESDDMGVCLTLEQTFFLVGPN